MSLFVWNGGSSLIQVQACVWVQYLGVADEKKFMKYMYMEMNLKFQLELSMYHSHLTILAQPHSLNVHWGRTAYCLSLILYVSNLFVLLHRTIESFSIYDGVRCGEMDSQLTTLFFSFHKYHTCCLFESLAANLSTFNSFNFQPI